MSTDHPQALPADHDAERAVLACCLRDPETCMPRVLAALGGSELAATAFYIPHHRLIFAGMEALFRRASTFDYITLLGILKDSEELEHAGGPGRVAEIVDDVPSVGMLDHYLHIIIDKAARRAIIRDLAKIGEKALDPTIERLTILDQAETLLFRLRQLGTDRAHLSEARHVRELLGTVTTELQHTFANRGQVTGGIRTGYIELDRMLMGMKGGQNIVLAARPAQGKTSLAMNIAEFVAEQEKVPVLIISLEMPSEELVKRMLTARADVDVYRMRDGFFSKSDLPRLMQASQDLSKAPIYFDNPPELRVHELRSRCRRVVSRYGVGLIVIDYLQLIKGSSKQAESNRYAEIGEISRGIKSMALELNVPIITLSQLNRKPEERRNGVPMQSDLRESGDIEQDADVIALLYRPTYYAKDADQKEATAHLAFLEISKQRNGPTGGGEQFKKEHPEWSLDGCPGIPLKFIANKVKFENPPGAKLYQ